MYSLGHDPVISQSVPHICPKQMYWNALPGNVLEHMDTKTWLHFLLLPHMEMLFRPKTKLQM